MPDYYVLSGTTNRHTDATEAVVLSVDENGDPDKVVSEGIPVKLSAEDRKSVEKLGYSLESMSKDDAEKFEAEAVSNAGDDVAHASPMFGGSEAANQFDQKSDK